MHAPSLRYSLPEIHSYLPTGWSLVDPDSAGAWDERKRDWLVEVRDGADMVWTVRVPETEAGRHGRLVALQRAVDLVYRTGLGKDGFFG